MLVPKMSRERRRVGQETEQSTEREAVTSLGGLLHPLLGLAWPRAWEQSPTVRRSISPSAGDRWWRVPPTQPGVTTEHPLSLRLKSGCSTWGPYISSPRTLVLEGQALCLDIQPGGCSGDIRAS